MNDLEIKKALECCSTYHDVRSCKNCPLDGKCEPNLLEQYALDLINRYEEEKQTLKAEVERLKDAIKETNCAYFGKSREVLNLTYDLKLKDAEISVLKAEVERLEKLLEQCEDNGEYWESKYKTAKAEAYKECIEKVRKLAVGMHPCSDELRIFDSDLNNLLNELVGDNNGNDL